MKILAEFWYDNIEPTEYDTSSCKEYKKLLELICRNEEKLRATMTDEQKSCSRIIPTVCENIKPSRIAYYLRVVFALAEE